LAFTDRWQYDTGAMQAFEGHNVPTGQIAGVVTAPVFGELLGDNRIWVQENGITCQIARYDSAALLIEPHAMLERVRQVLARGPEISIPTALLVQEHYLEMFRNYAWLMAQAGIVRGVFEINDAAKARAWALEQGQIHLHHFVPARTETEEAARPSRTPAP